MSISILTDPAAKRRSLMLKQKSLCDGCATGYECKHYWALVYKMDTPNPDHLRQGERARFCLLTPSRDGPIDLGDGGSDMAVYCNHYEPSNREFDSNFNQFNPLTPEEVSELEERDPSDPLPRVVEPDQVPRLPIVDVPVEDGRRSDEVPPGDVDALLYGDDQENM